MLNCSFANSNNSFEIFLLIQCLIGHGDVVMNCIMKVSSMVKQIQQAVYTKTPTKIIIENFQKRNGQVFTSETTSIELDNDVSYIFPCINTT